MVKHSVMEIAVSELEGLNKLLKENKIIQCFATYDWVSAKSQCITFYFYNQSVDVTIQ
jgi:hypothetical protein